MKDKTKYKDKILTSYYGLMEVLRFKLKSKLLTYKKHFPFLK